MVLLQTAIVKLASPDYPDDMITASLSLDVSSQRSYLRQNTQQMLDLEKVGKVKMLIYAEIEQIIGVDSQCKFVMNDVKRWES